MKNFIILIFLILLASQAKAQFYYGDGEATNLENVIGFDQNSQKIKTGTSTDPTSVAISGGAGSILLRTDGSVYAKKDAGQTTNWAKLFDTSDSLIPYIPTASSTQTGLLTSSDWVYFDSKVDNIVSDAPVNVSFTGNTASISIQTTTTPTITNVLQWNGTEWDAAPFLAPVGGNYVDFYLDDTASDIGGYFSLLNYPTGGSQVDDSATASTSHEVFIEAYASGSDGLDGDGYINAGKWDFHLYSYVDNSGGTSYLKAYVYKRTSGGVETLLFSGNTQDINNTNSLVPQLYTIESFQGQFAINSTDRLVVKFYAFSDSPTNKTIHLIHNGELFYSHIHSPILTRHNDLAGLQGGSSGEYYHLTQTEHDSLSTFATTASLNAAVTSSAIVAKTLDGYAKTGSLPLSSSDTILSAIGKLENNIGSSTAKEKQFYESTATITQATGEYGAYKFKYSATGSSTTQSVLQEFTRTASLSGYPLGIVAYWNMDGDAGAGEVNQYNPGTYDLVNVGTVSSVSGKLSTARGNLDSSNYLYWNAGSSNNTAFDSDEFVVGCWFKNTTAQNYLISMISKGAYSTDGWTFYGGWDDRSALFQVYYGGGSSCSAYRGSTLTDSNWHSMIGVYSNSGDFIATYYDGALANSFSCTQTLSPSSQNLNIGNISSTGNTAYKYLDECFYISGSYATENVAALATAIYNSGSGRLVSQGNSMTATSTYFKLLKKAQLQVTQENVPALPGIYNFAYRNGSKVSSGMPGYSSSATVTAHYTLYGDVGDEFEFGATDFTSAPSRIMINAQEW